MKVLSTTGLTKLIQLIKSSFISVDDTVSTSTMDAETTSEVTLATVATTGSYTDLSNKPDLSGYAIDIDVAHLAGDETITGVKSYSAMPALIFPDETRGTAPSSASYGGIAFLDNNGERMAILEKDHSTNGSISLNLRAANPTTTGTASQATLGVTYPMSGNPYTTAPASDVNGSIVTTVNKSKNSTGYLQLGNGIILNWGYAKMTNDTTTEMTFAKAFSGANNYGMAQGYWSPASSRQDPLTITAKTSTGFTIRNSAGSGTNYCFWVAIGY